MVVNWERHLMSIFISHTCTHEEYIIEHRLSAYSNKNIFALHFSWLHCAWQQKCRSKPNVHEDVQNFKNYNSTIKYNILKYDQPSSPNDQFTRNTGTAEYVGITEQNLQCRKAFCQTNSYQK